MRMNEQSHSSLFVNCHFRYLSQCRSTRRAPWFLYLNQSMYKSHGMFREAVWDVCFTSPASSRWNRRHWVIRKLQGNHCLCLRTKVGSSACIGCQSRHRASQPKGTQCVFLSTYSPNMPRKEWFWRKSFNPSSWWVYPSEAKCQCLPRPFREELAGKLCSQFVRGPKRQGNTNMFTALRQRLPWTGAEEMRFCLFKLALCCQEALNRPSCFQSLFWSSWMGPSPCVY